jgi:hypothetical protein
MASLPEKSVEEIIEDVLEFHDAKHCQWQVLGGQNPVYIIIIGH